MSELGYPPRLYWYIGAVLGVAVPVAAGAVVRVALDPPDLSTGIGIALFFGLALLADMKPVPLDVENERLVSLAFVFVVASQILFGWEYAVLTAILGVLISQIVERRPVFRSLFNSGVYGLAAFASALPAFAFATGSPDTVRLTLFAFTGGAAYVVVNVVLVCGALAIFSGVRLQDLLRDNLRHSGPAFVIMAFLAALAASLWTIDPPLLVLLAGPLFTLTLYQRSALSTKVATRDALTDSLTGLGNHRSYQARLREALARVEEEGGAVSLCLVDVDEFKTCNDRFGHPLGDQILVELAQLFLQGHEEEIAAFRFGGDEFALLVHANDEHAYRFVEDLHARLAQTDFPHHQPVTITVGIASFPGHAADADELQKVADGALYWAKRHGKNRSCVYSPNVVRIYSPHELTEQAERHARLRAAERLIRIVDSKDTYTGEHSEAVARLVEAVARHLGLDDDSVEQLRLAALLHDIGKIAIPDTVLQKPGGLDSEERMLVRSHVQFGYSLLEGLGIEPVDEWVLHHHEHWDGSGYPDGLAGEEIPFGSRVILVADAFDAMITHRTYRPALGPDEALAELRRQAGAQFDPAVVAALERCLLDEPEPRIEAAEMSA
jgi:diguanylate cyclase (GGDEF)-like protein/putative nucleotidyltransferase with HDIG domain